MNILDLKDWNKAKKRNLRYSKCGMVLVEEIETDGDLWYIMLFGLPRKCTLEDKEFDRGIWSCWCCWRNFFTAGASCDGGEALPFLDISAVALWHRRYVGNNRALSDVGTQCCCCCTCFGDWLLLLLSELLLSIFDAFVDANVGVWSEVSLGVCPEEKSKT